MKKNIHEKNFHFTSKNKNENSNLKNNEKVKIINNENIVFVNDKDLKKKKTLIKVLDYIVISINIITNIAFLFFIGDLINGFSYASGIGYTLTTTRTIGFIIFLFAQISGIYLTIKFFLKQNLKVRLLLASAPITFIFVGGLWFLYNINNIKITDSLSASAVFGLNENDLISIDFKIILIAMLVYLGILYILYSLIFKKSKANKIANEQPKK